MRLSALVTTVTLLSAMAAPATIGVRPPSAASGMPSTLNRKAQIRFCTILRLVARARTAASTS